MDLICPRCGEEDGMSFMYQFNSETRHLEVTMECNNPKCPTRFFGILYETSKPIDLEATRKAKGKKGKKAT